MRVSCIEIQNFRKLKTSRIELGQKETVLVGANNSGKTSAIDALILFLKKNRRGEIATTDFTLSNWYTINKIGDTWLKCSKKGQLNLDIEQWRPLVPSLDIWLDVNNSEIHYVSHLIPTLGWKGGKLGVRLSFEPKNIEKLYSSFSNAYILAAETASKSEKNKKAKLSLWPQSMKDYLEKQLLHSHFKVNAFLLDPSNLIDQKDGEAKPQPLPENSVELDTEPFEGLFKIDIINAQRGFSDAKSSESIVSGSTAGSLTTQLRSYFDKHLDPFDQPNENDIDALIAIETAKDEFDKKLKVSFSSSISELEGLGYPGFSDPQITLTSKLNPVDGLNHDSAVQFNVTNPDIKQGLSTLSLPEKYNGLGYQNLVSMVFKLIRFRDEWMRKGKAGKTNGSTENYIEPLHLVLIEEPEAHLHAQVQQVFIKKAYEVLRNHEDLSGSEKLCTQMVVSTHSSHIAHEIDFGCLRYFRRMPAVLKEEAPSANIVNLSKIFGCKDDTSKFATRYLKTTHCDLFFADAVIIVEGPAERMLVPHFIQNNYSELDYRYISVLEIGGSHAHRLRPLIEELGLLTLVITDIDSIKKPNETNKKARDSKVQPERNKGLFSGNDTLKSWIPKKETLDELLDLNDDQKISANSLIRVAYQYPLFVHIDEQEKSKEAIPYTFEDALVLSNVELFKGMDKSKGLIKKMCDSLSNPSITQASTEMFEALKTGKKAEMALELIFLKEPKELKIPKYIAEGLEWLQEKLKNKDWDYIESTKVKEEVNQ
jgi:predicted ATP-dependent endonuclease of OLD family